MDMENESVLSIYSIESDVVNDYTDFLQIWDNFVAAKVQGVSCREIVNVPVPASELYKLIELRDLSEEVFETLRNEFERGANVVFIQPVVGKPIGGFFLSNLVSN